MHLPRLELIRKSRGWSVRALSEASGVSTATISRYENDADSVLRDTAKKLADALGVDVGELYQTPQINDRMIHFRRRSTLGIKRQEQIEAAVIIEVERWLLESDFTPDPIKKLRREVDASKDVAGLARAMMAARIVRRELGLTTKPIPSMVKLLVDRLNVCVIAIANAPRAFDGHSIITERCAISAINAGPELTGDRERFTLAHELGHLILHTTVEQQLGNVEKEANAFASELLFPSAVRHRELRGAFEPVDWNALFGVKRKWKVSLAALVYAAGESGIIAEGQRTSIFKQISMRGWRKVEPEPIEFESLPRTPIHLD